MTNVNDAAVSHLPTVEEMFRHADDELAIALNALREAAAWLRSDWTPLGSSLTDEQAADRTRIRHEIFNAKEAISRARRS